MIYYGGLRYYLTQTDLQAIKLHIPSFMIRPCSSIRIYVYDSSTNLCQRTHQAREKSWLGQS